MLLVLASYNIITIIEVLLLIRIYLQISFLNLSIINYRNKIANLTFLIFKVLREVKN